MRTDGRKEIFSNYLAWGKWWDEKCFLKLPSVAQSPVYYPYVIRKAATTEVHPSDKPQCSLQVIPSWNAESINHRGKIIPPIYPSSSCRFNLSCYSEESTLLIIRAYETGKKKMMEEPSRDILNTQSIGDKNKIPLRGSTNWMWPTRVKKTLVWKRNCPIQRVVSTPVQCPEEYGSSPGSREPVSFTAPRNCAAEYEGSHINYLNPQMEKLMKLEN